MTTLQTDYYDLITAKELDKYVIGDNLMRNFRQVKIWNHTKEREKYLIQFRTINLMDLKESIEGLVKQRRSTEVKKVHTYQNI